MDLEILDLAAEMPSSRFQLKPPMFIRTPPELMESRMASPHYPHSE